MKYVDDKFKPFDVYEYRGPLPIDGIVVVVEWSPDRCVGNYEFREGLVPVYSDKFPATRFWWAAPCQLTPAPTGDQAEKEGA